MEINIQATIGVCGEYRDEGGVQGEVSIVITPLKVTLSDEQDKMAVVSGCNMWRNCHNGKCWYSLESRKNKKAPEGKSSGA